MSIVEPSGGLGTCPLKHECPLVLPSPVTPIYLETDPKGALNVNLGILLTWQRKYWRYCGFATHGIASWGDPAVIFR